MEEIRAYIESGILELYVLGDVSAEEKLQVETMAQNHPAVKAELNEIEHSMELYADLHTIEPAPELRERVLNSLLTNLGDDRNLKTVKHPDAQARMVSMYPRQKTTSIFYKYAFAASVLLLGVSVAALGVVYNRLQNSQQQVVSLTLGQQKFSRQVTLMDNELSVYRDTSAKLIHLKGTPKTPSSVLTVAWSPEKHKVMVDLHDAQLPVIDKDHQYQLWAIANSKPVDLGVFDSTEPDSANFRQMKPIGAAQAFAVTVEPRGGSLNPTMDQMVVIASL